MFNSVRRIQYASSLYVDKFPKVVGAHFVRPAAPTLVLAGRIGRLGSYQTQAFLAHCSRQWQNIIYVPDEYDLGPGSHDLGPGSHDLPSNVHLLNNRQINIGAVGFIGSPYNSTRDRLFMINILASCADPSMHLVAVTSSSLVHANSILPYNMWICGHNLGGRSLVSPNRVPFVYNARGPIDDENDFEGLYGWRRDAVIDLPDPYNGTAMVPTQNDVSFGEEYHCDRVRHSIL